MSIPRRGPGRRTVFVTILFLGVAVLVISTFGASVGSLTPRNDPKDARNRNGGELYKGNPGQDCLAHHRGEGMKDSHIIFPLFPQQLQVGQETEVPIQIINPWKQELRDISMNITLLGEKPILGIKGAATGSGPSDVVLQWNDEFGPNAQTPLPGGRPTTGFNFSIPAGAAGLSAHVELHPRDASLPGVPTQPNAYSVKFKYGGQTLGTEFEPKDRHTNLTRNITIASPQAGNARIEITHETGPAPSTVAFLDLRIFTGAGAAGKRYSLKVDAETIPKYQAYTFMLTVVPLQTGTQQMEIHVRAMEYYEHQDGVRDGGKIVRIKTPNWDWYNRYQTLDEDADLVTGKSMVPTQYITIGDTFIPTKYEATTAGEAKDDIRLVGGEVTGFGSALLLLPSLLLGGTYGRSSRRFFNALLGGAKRRVMFHNLLSLGLSLAAVVHLLLFTLDIRYSILMGVLWGGLGILSLLVLGLTGYYQVPLIQRHGFKWWRYTHLAFGILVVVFIAYHVVADGPDFYFLKQQLPEWINNLNLAQK